MINVQKIKQAKMPVPPFKNTCPCTILPPLFHFFRFHPLWGRLSTFTPPLLKKRGPNYGGSQKLLQGSISHELTVYLSIFNQFKLNELWPYYQKHVNQIILNYTTL